MPKLTSMVTGSSPSPAEALYHVTVRLQVSSFAGDSEYHLRMTERDITAILDGTATWLALPARFGAPDETRYVSVNTNILEITVTDLTFPHIAAIAQAQS